LLGYQWLIQKGHHIGNEIVVTLGQFSG